MMCVDCLHDAGVFEDGFEDAVIVEMTAGEIAAFQWTMLVTALSITSATGFGGTMRPVGTHGFLKTLVFGCEIEEG